MLKGKDPSLKIKYYLIGEGQETRNLKELVSNLHLQDSVVFVGACDYDTRNRYYKLSDVFIMPSIAQKNSIEGFGIVFLEANFYKLPTIGSFSGGVVEAIIDKKTGFLVKPDDLNDLVEKILLIVKNKEYKLEMGEFGHKRVVNEFNWAQIINEYIKTFMSVL